GMKCRRDLISRRMPSRCTAWRNRVIRCSGDSPSRRSTVATNAPCAVLSGLSADVRLLHLRRGHGRAVLPVPLSIARPEAADGVPLFLLRRLEHLKLIAQRALRATAQLRDLAPDLGDLGEQALVLLRLPLRRHALVLFLRGVEGLAGLRLAEDELAGAVLQAVYRDPPEVARDDLRNGEDDAAVVAVGDILLDGFIDDEAVVA